MSLRSKEAFLAVLAVLVFVVLIAFELNFSRNATALRRDIASLKEEQAVYEMQISRTASDISAYKALISDLSKYPITVPSDHVSFYSNVERGLTRSGVTVNSIRQVQADKGSVAVQVDFSGDYAAVLNAIAEWRQMKEIACLKSLLLLPGDFGVARGTALLRSALGGK